MGGVTITILVYFWHDKGVGYAVPGLITSSGRLLSQREKGVFAQEIVGLINRALN